MKFSKEYGLHGVTKTFRGRHGYAKKAFELENKNVKLIVVNKTDFKAFDTFIDRLYKRNPLELKIIEDLSEFEESAMEDDDVNLEDTLSLLSQYVDSLDTNADKDRLKTIMKELYVEAQDFEEA